MKLSSSKWSGITSALALFTNNLDVSGGKIHPFHLLYIFNVYKIRLITMHICHSIIDDGCRKSSKGDEDKCLATTHWTSSPLKYTCNKPRSACSYNQTLNGWGVESYELTNEKVYSQLLEGDSPTEGDILVAAPAPPPNPVIRVSDIMGWRLDLIL